MMKLVPIPSMILVVRADAVQVEGYVRCRAVRVADADQIACGVGAVGGCGFPGRDAAPEPPSRGVAIAWAVTIRIVFGCQKSTRGAVAPIYGPCPGTGSKPCPVGHIRHAALI